MAKFGLKQNLSNKKSITLLEYIYDQLKRQSLSTSHHPDSKSPVPSTSRDISITDLFADDSDSSQ